MDASDIETKITEAVHSRSSDFRKQSESLTLEGVRRLLEKDLGLEAFTLDAHKQLVKKLLQENFYSSEDEDFSGNMEDVENETENSRLGKRFMSLEPPKEKGNTRNKPHDRGSKKEPVQNKTDTEEPYQEDRNKAEPNKIETGVERKTELSSAVNEAIIKEAVLKRTAYLKAQVDSITMGGVRRLLEQDLQLEKKTLDVHKTLIRKLVDEIFSNAAAVPDAVKELKKKQVKKTSPVDKENVSEQEDVEEKRVDRLEDSIETTEISGEDEEMESNETLKESKAGKKRKNEGLDNKTLKGRKRKKEPESEGKKSAKKVVKKKKAAKDEDEEPLKPASMKKKEVDNEDGDEEPVQNKGSEESGSDSADEKVVKVQGKKATNTSMLHGERVEHLKKIIKSCGMTVPPVVYKKVKQSPENKREAHLIKELEAILKRESLSSNPTDKEIRAVKTRKERAKDLEGIDMTNIISDSRGRRATSNFFLQPPKYSVPDEGGEDSNDEESSESSEDEEPAIEEEEGSD